MTKMTITEALAEIKTVGKRIEKKREGILPFLARVEMVRDPLEKDGGSPAFVAKERQGIADLCKRIVRLRVAIQRSNLDTKLAVRNDTRTVAEWLTWRRDVSKIEQALLETLRNSITSARGEANKRNVGLRAPGEPSQRPEDIMVSLNEKTLAEQREAMETVLGDLDGALSLMNATTFVEVND